MSERIPLTLITGFLGSGKTTLLGHLLRDPLLSDAVVLVNELGEVPLDHHLLRQIDEKTVILDSGCVCCTIRTDLVDELRDLQVRQYRGEPSLRATACWVPDRFFFRLGYDPPANPIGSFSTRGTTADPT